MSTLKTTNIAHPSSASNNIVLDSSGRALIGVSSANANGGILQLSSGITFPATQVLSNDPNTLDDYEEGTFTPTIIGTSVAGTGTYSVQVGRYTKIGNRVHFQLYIVSTAHTGSGQMRIAGLPFTANSTSDNYCAVSCYYANVTMAANNVMIGFIEPNTAVVSPVQTTVGGGVAQGITLDPTSEIMFAGSYEV